MKTLSTLCSASGAFYDWFDR